MTTNGSGLHYRVRLAFAPFKSEYCEFVYHCYSIHASTRGESIAAVSVQERLKIVKCVQQVYESLAWKQEKYPFKFGQNELVSQPVERQSLIALRLQVVAFDELKWPQMTGPNTQEMEDGITSGLTQTEIARPGVRISVKTVQDSYTWAYSQGLLKSGQIPTAIQSPIWHPMRLPQREDYLQAQVLTLEKIFSINTELDVVMSKVPKSGAWSAAIEKKQLAVADIQEVIRLVKGEAPAEVRSCLSGGTLTTLIAGFHDHAAAMRSRQGQHGHAGRLAKLIEYSLMQIQEYQDGGNKAASTAVRLVEYR